jgi:hypothetical protein
MCQDLFCVNTGLIDNLMNEILCWNIGMEMISFVLCDGELIYKQLTFIHLPVVNFLKTDGMATQHILKKVSDTIMCFSM